MSIVAGREVGFTLTLGRGGAMLLMRAHPHQQSADRQSGGADLLGRETTLSSLEPPPLQQGTQPPAKEETIWSEITRRLRPCGRPLNTNRARRVTCKTK